MTAEVVAVAIIVSGVAALAVIVFAILSAPVELPMQSPSDAYEQAAGLPMEDQIDAVCECLYRHSRLCDPARVATWLSENYAVCETADVEIFAAGLSLGLVAGRIHHHRSPGDLAAVNRVLGE